MRTLILPVKRKWFLQIQTGLKRAEYRLRSSYWEKRLIGRHFDQIAVTLGYPARNDTSRRITFPWNGYTLETVTSEEWNNEPKEVFAIHLQRHATNHT